MTLEYILEICVAIDIAILGIAYPIIVDKISNIGEKFKSEYIPVIFNGEFPQSIRSITIRKKSYSLSTFKIALYLTLLSFLLLIFNFPPPFGWDNWFINNSAKLIVLILTAILTTLFLIWLDKVALFNGKSKSLLTYIILNHDKLQKETETKQYYLKAINELTFYAIEKQDEHLQKTLLDFYYRMFSKIRQNHDKTKPLVYPVDLYFLVNKLSAEAADNRNRRLKAIEHRAVSGTWLLGGDLEEITISEETYSWLWRSLYIICDNTPLVKMYWENASQYCNYRLSNLSPNYDYQENKITNEEEIEKRNKERKRFIEFNYAFGGLLLYRQQHKSIKYMLEFTQSQPPSYVMLPESMTPIFEWFEHFRNEFKSMPLDVRYSFPELDHLGNVGQIRYWICSFVALLFVRQYSLVPHLTTQNFTAPPNLPDSVVELNNWLDSVSYFERRLDYVKSNQQLLSTLGYSEIVEQKSSEFDLFIEKLRESIRGKISQQNLNASLSRKKIQSFYESTNSIVEAAFDEYNAVFIKETKNSFGDELVLAVKGGRTLMPKSAFTDHDIPIHGYHSIFAEQIASDNIKRLVPNSFATATTRRYLLNKDNIIRALSTIVDNTQNVAIIGVNVEYELEEILSKSSFSSAIIHIPSTEYHFQDKLYVLRRSDLPVIEHKELGKDEIEKQKLKKLNDRLNLYASVVDINEPEDRALQDEWNLNREPDSENLKVQISIAFLTAIYWKNDREVIQIDIASKYEEQGIQNNLNEVEPLQNAAR